jgi:hypothetical protein
VERQLKAMGDRATLLRTMTKELRGPLSNADSSPIVWYEFPKGLTQLGYSGFLDEHFVNQLRFETSTSALLAHFWPLDIKLPPSSFRLPTWRADGGGSFVEGSVFPFWRIEHILGIDSKPVSHNVELCPSTISVYLARALLLFVDALEHVLSHLKPDVPAISVPLATVFRPWTTPDSPERSAADEVLENMLNAVLRINSLRVGVTCSTMQPPPVCPVLKKKLVDKFNCEVKLAARNLLQGLGVLEAEAAIFDQIRPWRYSVGFDPLAGTARVYSGAYDELLFATSRDLNGFTRPSFGLPRGGIECSPHRGENVFAAFGHPVPARQAASWKLHVAPSTEMKGMMGRLLDRVAPHRSDSVHVDWSTSAYWGDLTCFWGAMKGSACRMCLRSLSTDVGRQGEEDSEVQESDSEDSDSEARQPAGNFEPRPLDNFEFGGISIGIWLHEDEDAIIPESGEPGPTRDFWPPERPPVSGPMEPFQNVAWERAPRGSGWNSIGYARVNGVEVDNVAGRNIRSLLRRFV